MHRPFRALCLLLVPFAWADGLSDPPLGTADDRTFTWDQPPVDGGVEAIAGALPSAAIPASAREPVILNFDRLPPANLWESWRCLGSPRAVASHGILTIHSRFNFCNEFILWHFDNTWHNYVDFARGWIIETSLRVDPLTDPECDDRGSVLIWAHDHTKLVIIGFSTDEICIAYPDNVRVPMETTDAFHVYRIESKGRRVQVFADGERKIDHRLSWRGGGTDSLTFGDGAVGGTSRSYWDYFSYDVFP